MLNLDDKFELLNKDLSHYKSKDDICTPLDCVRLMVNYIPKELWNRKNIKVLDPSCGNGNFGYICSQYTNIDNIYFNDINKQRIDNCNQLLAPKYIRNDDFLTIRNEWNCNWDLIIANPPYSGGGNKNKNIFQEFITLSVDLLNDKGYLCFITPNSWMTYNNNNKVLKKLLKYGSFIVIDNDVKKYFKNVGSSFTVFVWQKNVYDNKTYIVNNYLKKDIQTNINIPKDLPFIPLYISQSIIDIIQKSIDVENRNKFDYRCDLHNFTQKKSLQDEYSDSFPYRTIHTLRKTRYANKKQDIYDKYIIVIPLSTYYIPIIEHNANVTQSVGYFSFDSKEEAEQYKDRILKDEYKLLIHLTRYGNFNNLLVLKHLKFDENLIFTKKEQLEIKNLVALIKY